MCLPPQRFYRQDRDARKSPVFIAWNQNREQHAARIYARFGPVMEFDLILGGMMAIGLGAYLVYALFHPEKF